MVSELLKHSPNTFAGTDQQAFGGDANLQPMSNRGDEKHSMPRQRSASLAEPYMPSRLGQGRAAACQGSAVPR